MRNQEGKIESQKKVHMSNLNTCMPKKCFLQFCDKIQQSNLACTKYSPACIQQFPYDDHYTWRVSRDFYKPLPLKQCFPTFHHRASSFCCPPIISSLELSKKLKSKFITSTLGERTPSAAPELWLTIH